MKWLDSSRYDSTHKKWEEVIKALEQGKMAAFRGNCGFCFEAAEEAEIPEDNMEESGMCFNCVLYPKYCSDEKRSDALYWKFNEAYWDRDKKEAIELAKEILRVIESFKPEGGEESGTV